MTTASGSMRQFSTNQLVEALAYRKLYLNSSAVSSQEHILYSGDLLRAHIRVVEPRVVSKIHILSGVYISPP